MALLALAVIASAVVGAGASIVAGKKTEEAQEEQINLFRAMEIAAVARPSPPR